MQHPGNAMGGDRSAPPTWTAFAPTVLSTSAREELGELRSDDVGRELVRLSVERPELGVWERGGERAVRAVLVGRARASVEDERRHGERGPLLKRGRTAAGGVSHHCG